MMHRFLALLLLALPVMAEYVDGDLKILGPTHSLQLDTSAGDPAHAEGKVFYDEVNKALAYYSDLTDVTMQVGQETWVRVKNNTGVQIDNGSVVYVNGVDTGTPTIALAQANTPTDAGSVLGIATHDIADTSIGVITTVGTVRDFDTSTLTAGQPIYLSDSVAGGMTSTRPSFPSYIIRLGTCIISDATTGAVNSHINGSAQDIISNSANGSTLESTEFLVTSDGVTITGTLQQDGGGDLTLVMSDGFTVYDTSPAVTATLTAGTDAVPQINYVYVPKSTKVVTVSTAGFPATEHCAIATVLCQTAATLQTYGAHKVHLWTDHLMTFGDNGHQAHVNAWIRNQNATYQSGVVLTPTITVNGGAVDNIDIATTAGVVLQLHDHIMPAFDTAVASTVFITNKNGAGNDPITDLNAANEDSAGNVIGNNQHTNLVLWGVVNEESGDCKLYVNLPSTLHGTSEATALADSEGYTNYTIPADYKGVGFLIARLTLKYTTAASGTWTLATGSPQDLRGLFPSQSPGGSTVTSPGGVDTNIQFNDGGAFGGDANFTYDKTNSFLGLKSYDGATNTALVIGDITGNARGVGSVDIQTTRFAATQIASGSNSAAVGYAATASGSNSLAIGHEPTASGVNSMAVGTLAASTATHGSAVGYLSAANGGFGTAVGFSNIAGTNSNATAVGYDNTASGTDSTAVGSINLASGTDSVALGTDNTALDTRAVAIGQNNDSTGLQSMAFGVTNSSTGISSLAVGAGINATADFAIAMGKNVTNSTASTFEWGNSNTLKLAINVNGELDLNAHSIISDMQTTTGDGTTVIDWKLGNNFDFTFGTQNETTFDFTNPSKPGIFTLSLKQDLVGSRTITTWDADIIWATGSAPTLKSAASAVDIISFRYDGTNYYGYVLSDIAPVSPGGVDTNIQFNDGGAFGGDANFTYDKTTSYLTIKGATTNVAVGSANISDATNSTAAGSLNDAGGNYATAVGYSNDASNTKATAVGYDNTASGASGSSLGVSNISTGSSSTAVGWKNSAGFNGVAVGYQNTSGNTNGVAIGILCTVNNVDGVAIGGLCTASGDDAVAIGRSVVNTNTNSVEIGWSNTNKIAINPNGELDLLTHTIGGTQQTATGDGTTTIDWKLGNHFGFQFGAFNETFTFTAPTNPGRFTLTLTQDSVGSRTATWPAAVKWPGGTAPTLTTTLTTGVDKIEFYYDGTSYYGTFALDFQ